MAETQHSQIQRFIKILLICIVGIAAADLCIGKGLAWLYKKQKSGVLYRTTYSIDSTKADYIVLGSSRANHDYDPLVFEKILNASFYNCGRDKQGLLYSCAVLSAILDRYTPKVVIIDIRPDEFTQSDEGTLATLLPYYHNSAIRPYLDYNSQFEGVKLISSIYPYNSLLTNLFVGLKKDWKQDYKGYRELTNLNQDNALDTLKEGLVVDIIKLTEFNRTLDRLRQLKIPTYIVISPIHYVYISNITPKICAAAAKKYNNPFCDFTNTSTYRNNQYYSDHNHLNNVGASVFSSELANIIKTSPLKPNQHR